MDTAERLTDTVFLRTVAKTDALVTLLRRLRRQAPRTPSRPPQRLARMVDVVRISEVLHAIQRARMEDVVLHMGESGFHTHGVTLTYIV